MKLVSLIIVVIFVLASCSDVAGPTFKSPEEPGPSLSEPIFPHKASWGDPEEHGSFVVDHGSGPCANACHGVNFEGGGARSCKTCHSVYPHEPANTWQGLSGHGKFVREGAGTNMCATRCHGEDLAGGYDPENKKSCAKCHASYPKPHLEVDWGIKGHGVFVSGSNECTAMCHRPDVPEELKIKDCASCHPSYPHGDPEWKTVKHKEFLSQYGGITSSDCTTCHGQKLEGGSSGIACATRACHHTGGADSAKWPDKEGHGEASLTSLNACLACHSNDLKGNAIVRGCDLCHHKNWLDTHEKPWGDATQHGLYGGEPASSCKLCHGGDLSGGLSGVACKTCHNGLYPHQEGWVDKAMHGLAARGDLNRCRSCHGDITSNDCKSCHHDSATDWVPTSHQPASKIDGCEVCHGQDLYGGQSNRSCYECHDEGSKYPHPAGWGEADQHGVTYIAGKEACKTACHGGDLEGGLSQTVCDACHIRYPHANAWSSNHGDGVLTANDEFDSRIFEADCKGCHGQAEKLNSSFPSTTLVMSTGVDRCYKCHTAYPHMGFKDTINGSEVDVLWPGRVGSRYEGGHWRYLVFNSEYKGKDNAVKEAMINSLYKGCVGTTACHKVSRHGPYKNYNRGCKGPCHR